jgi:hypothetical protein
MRGSGKSSPIVHNLFLKDKKFDLGRKKVGHQKFIWGRVARRAAWSWGEPRPTLVPGTI